MAPAPPAEAFAGKPPGDELSRLSAASATATGEPHPAPPHTPACLAGPSETSGASQDAPLP